MNTEISLPQLSVNPVNLSGGQCDHCGQYGHNRKSCGLLKSK